MTHRLLTTTILSALVGMSCARPLPPEEPTPPAGSHPRSRRRGRSLNWTFEVPGQESPSIPAQPPTMPYALDSSFGPGLDSAAQHPEPPADDEGAAGPFA